MRVLHLDAATESRGGQRQLRLLLRHAPGVHRVALPEDAPLRRDLADDGHTPVAAIAHGWLSSVRPVQQAIGLVLPDLIAAHTPQAHALAVRAGAAVPVLVHRRVDFAPRRDPFTRARYAAAHGYIAVSHAVAEVLTTFGVPSERIVVVHDGVEVDAHRPDPEGAAQLRAALQVPAHTLLIGAVGALVPHKGHIHLVRAMAQLGRPDAHAVIAGEGPERARLQRAIDRSGAPVTLLGHRTAAQVRGLLGAIEVLAHPSVEEGLGQAVIEAMMGGVPVIASRAGGLPELLRDGQTGDLVAPGDVPAWTQALSRALLERHRVRAQADRALHHARAEHSATTMAQRTVQAYQSLLGAR